MEKCRTCGAELAEDVKCCPQCGTANANNRSDSRVAEAHEIFTPRSDLHGIGGWLILLAIGLAIAPFVSLNGIFRDFRLLFDHSHGALGTYRGLALLVLFEAVTNTIFFLSLIGLNMLFYLKKRSFPGWMITFLCVQLFIVLVDHFAAMRYFPTVSMAQVTRSVIGAVIWIPYCLRSQRVKETFIS